MPQYRIAGRKIDGREGRRTKILRIALGGALAAFAMCANYSAARAGDDDVKKDESITDKVMHSFGLKGPDDTDYDINYSERSPLVVPPNRNLPPPVSTNGPPVPSWPVDPEVKKRAASKDDDKPAPRPYDSVMNSSRVLTPAELGVGGAAVPAPGAPEQSSPSQLGEKKSSFLSFDWLKKEEYGTFTGEPPRVSLTDPPSGYQTPSPDQPYGITPEQKLYKPPSLGERMEPQSGSASGH